MTTTDLFDLPVFTGPAKREIIKLALRAYQAFNPARPLIIEVGTLRFPLDLGDGHAAVLFAEHAQATNAEYHTVDTNREALATCLSVLAQHGLHAFTTPHHDDGAGAIRGIGKPIDVLYLDSSDDPLHTLEQYTAAQPLLHAGSVIIIDDTHAYNGNAFGKGSLAIPRAHRDGFSVTHFDVGAGCRMTMLRRAHA